MDNRQDFIFWLSDQHKRVERDYRTRLEREIAAVYRTMGKHLLHEYKHLLIASLKEIEKPTYEPCEIDYPKHLQLEIYNKLDKPNLTAILQSYINKINDEN
jgi:hypothetical protein